MLTQHGVSKTGNGNILWDLKILTQKDFGTTCRNQVVDSFDGGRIAAFIDQLNSCLGAVLDGSASLEHKLFVDIQPRLAKCPAIAFKKAVGLK